MLSHEELHAKMLVTRDHLLQAGFSRDVIEVALSALLTEALPADHRLRGRVGAVVLESAAGALTRHLRRYAAHRTTTTTEPEEAFVELSATKGTMLAIVTVLDDLDSLLLGRVGEISTPVPQRDRDQPSARCGQQNEGKNHGG